MGHRALVACERADGRHDLHYAHWGAAGIDATPPRPPATPLDDPVCAWARRATARLVADAHDLSGAPPAGDDTAGDRDRPILDARADVIDPSPVATGLTFEAIVADHVDPLEHEALYCVGVAGEVLAYHVLWFGLSATGAGAGGALVTARWRDEDEAVRTWFRATKAVVADVLDRGLFSECEAIAYLDGRVREWAGDRRDVIRLDRVGTD